MLTHPNPVASADNLADYVNANLNSFEERIRAFALEAIRNASPVVRLVSGMETIFAALVDGQPDNREDALNALGSAAMQVAEGGFWSKQDRALAIVKWVRFELGEWSADMPAPVAPEVEAQYRPAPEVIVPTAPEIPAVTLG